MATVSGMFLFLGYHLAVDADGETSGGCRRRSSNEITNGRGNFRAMRLKREVTRIQEANVRTRNIAPVGFGPWGQEEWIVAPPDREQRRLTITEVGLEFGIEFDVTGIVEQQVELRFVRSWACQVEIVERIAVGRNH